MIMGEMIAGLKAESNTGKMVDDMGKMADESEGQIL